MSIESPTRAGVSAWWRALAIVLLLALLLAWAAAQSLHVQLTAQIAHLQQRLTQQAALHHVAVLLDAQQAPAMLVTVQQGAAVMQLQRLNAVRLVAGGGGSHHVTTRALNRITGCCWCVNG